MRARLLREHDAILSSCAEIAFFMRGAIQYKDTFELTPNERTLINKFISKRLEVESKKPNPVY
jgi:hypothetical protein